MRAMFDVRVGHTDDPNDADLSRNALPFVQG
jgi:hypothetical protein